MCFTTKVLNVKKLFDHCATLEEKYNKIIDLGKVGADFDQDYKLDSNRVPGCQSTMYLHSWVENGSIYFKAWSDALISAGLAELLILAYSGETPEVVLKKPPRFLEELDIPASLTPNRASGLYQIHLKMQQEALKHLMKK